MWKTLSSLLTRKGYLRKNRITYESLNYNITTCLEEHKKHVKEKNPDLTKGVYKRDVPSTEDDIVHYKFKFKNLVLAGSGANGVAYSGVAMALEECGILKDIKRFAGSSTGAIVAALLSIGVNSKSVKEIMEGISRDSSFPADIRKSLGNNLKTKTGSPDITFSKIFEVYQKELCIVVRNATEKSHEYCHVNTTPDMPIRDAVHRSIKVTLQELRDTKYDKEAFYNYPIHCFDDLWLRSMDKKQQGLIYQDPYTIQDRYLETLGCLVYPQDKYHSFRDQIEKKCNVQRRSLPDTELSRKWQDQQVDTDICRKFYFQCIKYQIEFLNIFYEVSKEKKEFTPTEFEQILTKAWADDDNSKRAKDVTCHSARTYAKMIYGKDADEKNIFGYIEKSDEKKVTRSELLLAAKEIGSILFQRYQDFRSKQKEEIMSYVSSIVTGYRPEINNNFVEEDDVARTVGINTWYIDALDFAMKEEDINFLIDQGKRSTVEFLKCFALDHNLTAY